MNTASIVRWDADPEGVSLRLWIDDESQKHLAVAEMRVTKAMIAAYARAVDDEQQRADQYQLEFDD